MDIKREETERTGGKFCRYLILSLTCIFPFLYSFRDKFILVEFCIVCSSVVQVVVRGAVQCGVVWCGGLFWCHMVFSEYVCLKD